MAHIYEIGTYVIMRGGLSQPYQRGVKEANFQEQRVTRLS